jgi:arylsulfatase A
MKPIGTFWFWITLVILGAAPVGASESVRPNIVFILADDMGRGDVSAYNPAAAWKTPNIDRLATGGMRFTDAHSSSAVCTPSRYAILTGRYNWRSARKSGVGGGLSPALVETGRMTAASLLRDHGYRTAMIGKWHLGLNWSRADGKAAADDPLDGEAAGRAAAKEASGVDYTKPFGGGPIACGFESFFGISASLDMPPYAWLRNDRLEMPSTLRPIAASKDYAMWRAGLEADGFTHQDALPREAREAVDYINRQDAQAPFFLYLALTAPHTPIVPTPQFAGRTKTTEYGDFCVQVDAVVGQVLDALAARGLERNTLVIFTADNGCSPSANFKELAKFNHDPQAGLRGEKADIYEGGHRIPFLVRWPGHVPAAAQSVELIYQGDLLATCADLLGMKLPDNAGEDSASLVAVMTARRGAAPVHAALVHHSINGSFAIREGPWKLCLCADSGGWSEPLPGKAPPGSPPFQLFNLETDPAEKTNLYASHPEIVDRLGRLLKSYVLSGRSTPGSPQSNSGGNEWRELAWMKSFQ